MSYPKAWDEFISKEIRDLLTRDAQISLAEFRDMRLNSYEREVIVPKLDNEALIWLTEGALLNCSQSKRRPCIVYDQAVIELYAPELLKRLAAQK